MAVCSLYILLHLQYFHSQFFSLLPVAYFLTDKSLSNSCKTKITSNFKTKSLSCRLQNLQLFLYLLFSSINYLIEFLHVWPPSYNVTVFKYSGMAWPWCENGCWKGSKENTGRQIKRRKKRKRIMGDVEVDLRNMSVKTWDKNLWTKRDGHLSWGTPRPKLKGCNAKEKEQYCKIQ